MGKIKNSEIIDLVTKKLPCYYKSGDFIISQGEKVGSILYINKGKAKVTHKNSNGKEFNFLQVQKGDYLGIHSLISKKNSFVSVIATEPLMIYKITEENLNFAMKNKPEISLELMKQLCSKIGLIESKIAKTFPENIKKKVAKILLSDSESVKMAGLSISYTIQELASLAGTTKNYIYRILSELEELQLLSIKDKKVKITDENKLAKFVQNYTA